MQFYKQMNSSIVDENKLALYLLISCGNIAQEINCFRKKELQKSKKCPFKKCHSISCMDASLSGDLNDINSCVIVLICCLKLCSAYKIWNQQHILVMAEHIWHKICKGSYSILKQNSRNGCQFCHCKKKKRWQIVFHYHHRHHWRDA